MAEKPRNKAHLLALVREGWETWQALLVRVPRERMLEPAMGGWTVKDIVAHITWGEREITPVLAERVLKGSDLWSLPLHERNAAMVAESRSRALDAVLEEHVRVHAELVQALEGLAEEELFDPGRFSAMPADWEPWEMVAGNTYGHYPEHIAPLEHWLGG